MELQKNCEYDALTIYDGHEQSNMLARLCGKAIPKSVIASSNKALVRFQSDNSVDARGFVLNFFSGRFTFIVHV